METALDVAPASSDRTSRVPIRVSLMVNVVSLERTNPTVNTPDGDVPMFRTALGMVNVRSTGAGRWLEGLDRQVRERRRDGDGRPAQRAGAGPG